MERTDQLPFSLQNVWGQLDKQRATEQEVALQARAALPGFSVLRVPKLKDDAAAQAGAYSDALSVRAQLQPGAPEGAPLASGARARAPRGTRESAYLQRQSLRQSGLLSVCASRKPLSCQRAMKRACHW